VFIQEPSVEIYGIRLPIIEGKCDLVKLIVDSVREQGLEFRDGDIIVLTCKLVSKCLGLLVDIREIKPSPRALRIASRSGLDPRFVELVLRESDGLLLAIPVKKLVDEGIVNLYEFSRNPELAPNIYSITPRNIDVVAKVLRDGIRELTGKDVAVVICDTEVSTAGSMDVARGIS